MREGRNWRCSYDENEIWEDQRGYNYLDMAKEDMREVGARKVEVFD